MLEDWHTGDGIQTEVWVVYLRPDGKPEVRKQRVWRSHHRCRRTLGGGLTHTQSTNRPEESAQQEAMDGCCSWPSAPTPHGVHLPSWGSPESILLCLLPKPPMLFSAKTSTLPVETVHQYPEVEFKILGGSSQARNENYGNTEATANP